MLINASVDAACITNGSCGNLLQHTISGEEQVFRALKGVALTLLVLWTVAANCLVFVVLYKNPRLQTVPNLLVGNLAFSDLCLGLIVLPLSSTNAIGEQWFFGKILCEIWLSADILCCTASIWNMSTIGMDRYWAITSPVTYINKRNKRTAFWMIALVWVLAALISLAPFLGWKAAADAAGNLQFDKEKQSYQCTFLDLPAYTIYSATGSFFVPSFVMFFVYYKIYRAFAEHRARQIYRQQVIRKHIESTILHEISHVLPTSDEFAKSDEDEDDDDEEETDERQNNRHHDDIIEEEEEKCLGDVEDGGFGRSPNKRVKIFEDQKHLDSRKNGRSQKVRTRSIAGITVVEPQKKIKRPAAPKPRQAATPRARKQHALKGKILTFERVQRHKNRKEKRAMMRKHLEKKPAAISAAKERRGVKVLGIILGCFIVCWTPFFFMYLLAQFCDPCKPNAHIEQFITWLGYSNSAMNPIIYTVFNRDYQNALKRLFAKRNR